MKEQQSHGKKVDLYNRAAPTRFVDVDNQKTSPSAMGHTPKVGFNGTETATYEPCLNRAKEIDGPTLKLNDVEDLCASARFCHRAGGIWKLVPESDKPESKKIAIEEACECPSGRLIIKDKKAVNLLSQNATKPLQLLRTHKSAVEDHIVCRVVCQ